MGNKCTTCFKKKKEPRRRRSRSASSDNASESGESSGESGGKDDDITLHHEEEFHDEEYSEGGNRIARPSPFADAALANRIKRREKLEKRMEKYQQLQYEVSMKFNQSTHVRFVVDSNDADRGGPLEDDVERSRQSPGPANNDDQKFNVSGCGQEHCEVDDNHNGGHDDSIQDENAAGNDDEDIKHLFCVPTLLGSGDEDHPHSVREDSGSTDGPPMTSNASTPTSRGARLVYLPLGISDGTIQDNKARRHKKKEVLMD
ncbi:Hypothetical protein, putative [Bodo saltans]|uniref:Uncharacterized protein n=1 Tax=Bodo saltans TaxID=75058 RepID=A0A0S4J2E3_BODSA|nr:Hypothetical protein, putative [Bodo saltans]|eukprot:CUG54991.1 Hypothetical protein, putative [Bodo saltans]